MSVTTTEHGITTRSIPDVGWWKKWKSQPGDSPVFAVRVFGTLQSLRSKELKFRSQKITNIAIRRASDKWMEKLALIGALEHIGNIWAMSRLLNKKMEIQVIVGRKVSIRDTKNLLTGFDVMFLDGLSRKKIISSDSSTKLTITSIVQEKPQLCDSEKDNVWMRFGVEA